MAQKVPFSCRIAVGGRCAITSDCKKTAVVALFWEVFLCVSRACLGETMRFIFLNQKTGEKCRFLTCQVVSPRSCKQAGRQAGRQAKQPLISALVSALLLMFVRLGFWVLFFPSLSWQSTERDPFSKTIAVSSSLHIISKKRLQFLRTAQPAAISSPCPGASASSHSTSDRLVSRGTSACEKRHFCAIYI